MINELHKLIQPHKLWNHVDKLWTHTVCMIGHVSFWECVLLCQQMPLNYLHHFIRASTSCPNTSVQEEVKMATLLGSESPCTGGKRRHCRSNIITTFTASKITGQGFSQGTQVREATRVATVQHVRKLLHRDQGLALAMQPENGAAVPGITPEVQSLLTAWAFQLATTMTGVLNNTNHLRLRHWPL